MSNQGVRLWQAYIELLVLVGHVCCLVSLLAPGMCIVDSSSTPLPGLSLFSNVVMRTANL